MTQNLLPLVLAEIGRNTLVALLGCALFGAVAGAVGTFVLARRQALIADVAGHASLPGVCIGFLLGEALGVGGRTPWLLVLGASCSALLASVSVPALARLRGVGPDGAIAVSLSFFFGLGTVLLSSVQSHDSSAQGGLRSLLFGSVAGTTSADIVALTALACVALLVLVTFFKEFAALAFDESHARSVGLPVRRLDLLLLFLLVVTVVSGMQVAGIVLVVALIVTPAAAARAFRGSIARIVSIGALFGVLSAIAGVALSLRFEHFPTGSAMTLAATAILFATLLLRIRPTRGVVT